MASKLNTLMKIKEIGECGDEDILQDLE